MFEEIVSEYLNIKNTNSNYEFEIRFGTFNHANKFDCNTDISFFYRLKKILKIQNDNKNHKKSVYIDNILKSGIRETIKNQKKFNIYKKSIKYHNECDYDIRFSIASETLLKDDQCQKEQIKVIELKREKERDSYYFACGKIDLTKVKETMYGQNNEVKRSQVKYEIEFEINNRKENTASEICDIIRFILQINRI